MVKGGKIKARRNSGFNLGLKQRKKINEKTIEVVKKAKDEMNKNPFNSNPFIST